MKRTFGLLLIFFTAITSRAALTWHWAWLPSDMNASNSIAAAMNQAVAVFNTYSDYNYDIAAAYNSGVPTARVNLAMSLSAGALNLTWPGDHTGWRLQVQTNAPSLGLGTTWVDVPGSSLTNNLVIPVDPTQGSVFYRLVY